MTLQTMTETRFAQLAQAYGGDWRRWPQAEAESARAWAEANPGAADRLLFEARQTDAALDAAPRPVMSAALRDQVIASATAAGLKARATWPWLRRLLWIGGAGWAAAACAGVVFGTTLGSQIAADTQAFAVLDQALDGGLDDTEVLG